MKKTIKLLPLGLLSLVLLFSTAFIAKYNFADDVTIKGEVLDMNCYMTGEKSGLAHKSCAQTCLNGDAPVGLLSADKKVYLLIKDNSNAEAYKEIRKHAAENVEVTGKKIDRNGVTGILVSSVKY